MTIIKTVSNIDSVFFCIIKSKGIDNMYYN